MYAYIKGSLEFKSSNYVIIEAMGIGYKIFMGESSINSIGDIGANVKIFTHYHVREDDISLYGFKTNEELRMFELLISVSGVGGKTALVMLSSMEPSSFALAIITNDINKLVKIPGIGKKTAARIVLELKDKIKEEEAVPNNTDEAENKLIDNEKVEEAVSALQVLGYSKREIERVIEKLNSEELSLEELIKEGLKYLSNKN